MSGLFWKTEGENAPWNWIEDTPAAREAALKAGAMFFTTISFSEKPLKAPEENRDLLKLAVHRQAKSHKADFDNKKNPAAAFEDARRYVRRLEVDYGVPNEALDLFYSGSKGAHVETPAELFGPEYVEGDKLLPSISKRMDKVLLEGLPTADRTLNCTGRGKMFREANVRRANGRHKIPLTAEELLDPVLALGLDEIIKLSEQPRHLPDRPKPEGHSEALRALYLECRAAVYRELENPPKAQTLTPERLAALKDKLPPCMTQSLAMRDYEKLKNINFNRKLHAVDVPYFRDAGYTLDEAQDVALDFLVEFTGSASYPTPQDRIDHFRMLWGAAKNYRWDCNITKGLLKCGRSCPGCPINHEQLRETFNDFPKMEDVPGESFEVGAGDEGKEAALGLSPRSNSLRLDLSKLTAARLLEGEIEPIKYFYYKSLVRGLAGLIAGPPSVGKSFWFLQVLVARSGGFDAPLAGLAAHADAGPEKVFGLFCEDDERILAQRLRDILDHYADQDAFADNPEAEKTRAAVAVNLHIISGVGRNCRLMEIRNGVPQPTAFYEHLLETLKGAGFTLIGLDCLSRLFAGNENDNSQATFFAELIERLAQETGATVLVLHHTGKSGTSKGSALDAIAERLSADKARGASAFQGAFRWQMSFTDIRPKEASMLGAVPDDSWKYAAAKVSMSNNGQGSGIKFLRRGQGGVLVECTPNPKTVEGLEELPCMILKAIAALEKEGRRVTRRTFQREYARLWKPTLDKVSAKEIEDQLNGLILNEKVELVSVYNTKNRSVGEYLALSKKGEK